MLKGRPQNKDWSLFETRFTFGAVHRYGAQCGPYALHTITKHPYPELEKLSVDGHLGNAKLFKYLKKYGYDIHPVTLGNTVHGAPTLRHKNLLTMHNVVLLDQKCFNGENTWAVLHNNILAHSGEIAPYNPMDLLNYPIQAAYVIWHKKWNMK